MVQALVPLKDLVQAKTRLAGLLGPSERRALAQAMVEDVLDVLQQHQQISNITLVSDDPAAQMLAAKYGGDCWPESSLQCRGLNRVIERASERILAASAQPLLVLHADLPLLSSADISAVLEAQRQLSGLLIGCDRHGQGTNLLAFDETCVPHFCFGVDSCAGHRQAAQAAGLAVAVLQRPGIAIDVDDAQDMRELLAALDDRTGSHTFKLLRNTALGARVELALATLPGATQKPKLALPAAADAADRSLAK